MRLALYAHYSKTGGLALYVPFYLQKLRDLGFRVCFISNSPVPESRQSELLQICEKVLLRENTGFDFAMWQHALAQYSLSEFHELLLTNSSVIGPLHPLEPLWRDPVIDPCDFWGFTDNDECGCHLQSYFMLFRRRVLEHPCFLEFWRSVLPLNDRQLIIQGYEVVLTRWLEQHGFKWSALFPQKELQAKLLRRRKFGERFRNRIWPRKLPSNTSMLLPHLLLECGMPFLKARLLQSGADLRMQVGPDFAMRLLASADIPADVKSELQMEFEAERKK